MSEHYLNVRAYLFTNMSDKLLSNLIYTHRHSLDAYYVQQNNLCDLSISL